MKGKILKLRHLLTMAILVACLVGCGNQESTTTEPTTEVEEPTVAEKPAETVEPTDEIDSEKVEEKEEPKQEEVAEEPTEETYNGMPVAKVATTVSDIYAFLDYAESLDEPALLIYNESEGYVINMGEGEYYQLKGNDRIFEFWSNNGAIEARSTLKPLEETSMRKNLYEVIMTSGSNDSPQENNFVVFFTENEYDGEYFLLTYYLDAPTE